MDHRMGIPRVAKAHWRLEKLKTLARTYLFSVIRGTSLILLDDEIAEVMATFWD